MEFIALKKSSSLVNLFFFYLFKEAINVMNMGSLNEYHGEVIHLLPNEWRNKEKKVKVSFFFL